MFRAMMFGSRVLWGEIPFIMHGRMGLGSLIRQILTLIFDVQIGYLDILF